MELDQIKAIISMMKENDLSEFSMEQDGLKIRIKRGPEGIQQTVTSAPAPLTAAAPAPPATGSAAAPTAPAEPATDIEYIVSPMVGTFYRSPSPDSPPYVDVGQQVGEDSVVCIIEAMKVMNEVKAGKSGTVAEILLRNGDPVEFGTKLIRIT